MKIKKIAKDKVIINGNTILNGVKWDKLGYISFDEVDVDLDKFSYKFIDGELKEYEREEWKDE